MRREFAKMQSRRERDKKLSLYSIGVCLSEDLPQMYITIQFTQLVGWTAVAELNIAITCMSIVWKLGTPFFQKFDLV